MKTTKILLAGLCALFAASSYCAIRAVTPTVWNRGNGWQLKRHAEKMKSVEAGGAKLVFIGDSITHNWESKGKAQWEKYFARGKYAALNLGYSADRTEHVLWRIREGGELDGYEAKCIVLMIGTNNTGHFPIEEEPPVDTIFGIREILAAIAEKQPNARTILLSIFPRGADPTDPNRRRNDVVNKEISLFADGKRVIWCDFSDKFLDSEGRLSRDLFPDLLHPIGIGYEIWASSIIPVIDAVFAAGEGECIPSVWPSCPRVYNVGSHEAAQPKSKFADGKWWIPRCLEKRNEIVDGSREYDIVMVGDSITHRWEREGGEGRALFAELKKTYSVLNLGYGGDRTEHAIWRMENGELEGYKAKLFTLMIGTNNGGRDPKGVAAGIKRIIDRIRQKHPESKIVLMPIFPRADVKPGSPAIPGNEQVNSIIKDFADGDAVRWLDFNAKFLNAEGKLTRDVMNDLLHPNEKGYKIWLDAIIPVFREICGK